MSRNNYIVTFYVLLLLSGCDLNKPTISQESSQKGIKENISGKFSISGAYALYPLVRRWADNFMEIYPDVVIDVTKTGTGQGIEDLLLKKSHLAMISRALTDDEINNGIWSVAVAKDGVAPIVNQKNPNIEVILKNGLSPDEYLRAFTSSEGLTWGDLLKTDSKDKVSVFIRDDMSGASDIFADFIYRKSSDLSGIKVRGDEEMIRRVQDDKFALGFCNFSYAFDISTGERKRDIQIVPSDLDFDNKIDKKEIPFETLAAVRRGLWLGIYPKNLCRELTIGSFGKPSDPAIIEFLEYVLTDGQNSIEETGLCELNNFYIRYSLEKLN